jgi:hypothetical protein
VAIAAGYRKVQETPDSVEYLYGDPEPDRRLTFSKAERTFVVADGREDHVTRAVVLAVLRRLQETGTWPKGGGVQH